MIKNRKWSFSGLRVGKLKSHRKLIINFRGKRQKCIKPITNLKITLQSNQKQSTQENEIQQISELEKLLEKVIFINFKILNYYLGSYALVKIVKDKITGTKCVWKVYEKYRLHT